MEIQFTTQVFQEGNTFVAHTPELDVSSCGETEQKALENLSEAVTLFLEEADKIGTLHQILEEAGFLKRGNTLKGPKEKSKCRSNWGSSAFLVNAVQSYYPGNISNQ